MPKVSVITRTYDRLPLLKRCFASLQQANIEDLEWIVVDDQPGANPQLREFIESAGSNSTFPVRLVVSGVRHRAKAANAGLAVATGELVHFLDDDDTVAPSFYRKTCAFLAENSRFGAVVTLADGVLERWMPDGSFVELKRIPHYPETRAVSLAELAVVQTFPPVAFLARRDRVEAVGGFRETLEVCEDYDFYLRFLTRFDIGVMPEVLCAFHQRAEGDDVPESWLNSPASRQHRIEDKLFRNALLRQDLELGRIGIGWLLALGDMTRAAWRINLVLDALQRRSWPRALLNWLRRSGQRRQ
ncbi:MAG TPA: glycosyltransferase family A protein [Candidatus Binatia bacterium]|nr:glycosyltransferase family A protein [Candidatus Binatia bacterium]